MFDVNSAGNRSITMVMMMPMVMPMMIMVLTKLAKMDRGLGLSHTVEEDSTYEVQSEPGAADDEHQFGILNFYKEERNS